jgi:DNA repair exonuclease SbcCD ATPase subunit
MNLQEMRTKIERKKGQKEQILITIRSLGEEITQLQKSVIASEEAQTIIQIEARKTQAELEYRLSELVSLCLKSVFPNPYEFVVNFIIKRGSTECELLFKRNDNLLKPLEASGIGAVDVAAFGLRIAAWSLSKPRTSNVLILDEPFKHLKGIEANKRVIQMVKALSKQLDLQIIMVSDERVPLAEIEKGADKIFKVTMTDDVSSIGVYRDDQPQISI